MTRWWKDRSDREQLLLASGGGVCLIFAIYMLVYLPLVDYRDGARATFSRAEGLFEDVSGAAQDVIALKKAADRRETSSNISLRRLVTQTAKERGLVIARLEPSQTKGLTVWIDEAPVQTVQKWVAGLYQEDGVAVLKASIQKNDQGESVRAQFQFAGGQEG